jgi:hypothetical protein
MTVPVTLESIFGAYVGQGTLEDAAIAMAELALSSPALADEFTTSLKLGCAGQSDSGISLIEAVTESGFYAKTTEEAIAVCEELLSLYLQRVRSLASGPEGHV